MAADENRMVHRLEVLFRLPDFIEKRAAAAKARAEKLTQAILAKAFRGELVPTEAEVARPEGRRYAPASALLERIQTERAASANKRGRPGRDAKAEVFLIHRMRDLSAQEREFLNSEVGQLYEQLLAMTGRDDRLARRPLIEENQKIAMEVIWGKLKKTVKEGLGPRACRDLLNRLLLSLAINPVSEAYFNTVFPDVDFSRIEPIRNAVKKFRVLCMLEFGNFRFGYKRLRQDQSIREKWARYFPSQAEIRKRREAFSQAAEPVGLDSIPGSQLFSLGYLAGEHAKKINGARVELKKILDEAIKRAVNQYDGLEKIAKSLGTRPLTSLIAEAGIPGTETLIYSELPLFSPRQKKKNYTDILLSLREECETVDEEAIKRAQETAGQNARTYMAMHDIDVYIATSMREPLHFTTNWAFVHHLFHTGDLAKWHLRYFDPTQAYLRNRVQKGLLECLMIKRARLSVYNAQEADTFGKDAEAGVTLAQGKPVIVYVARLFENLNQLVDIYRAIDAGARVERDIFVDHLAGKGLLDTDERAQFLAPEKTKGEVVAHVLRIQGGNALRAAGDSEVHLELIRPGYDPEQRPTDKDLRLFAVEKMLLLERRALTFRDIHPLSLQTSPMDGVARGIIVTRSIEDTANVISGIFLGTLEYDIAEDRDNWLLLDKITGSPVRAVTKDPILTTSFWSERWGNSSQNLEDRVSALERDSTF